MSQFTFLSPGVKINEVDNTQIASSTPSSTAFALLGETLKGPAFQPVKVSTPAAFLKLFGRQSPEKLGSQYRYLLPYYANAYLDAGSDLVVTRILGLSGHNAGDGTVLYVNAKFTGNDSLDIDVAVPAVGSPGDNDYEPAKPVNKTNFNRMLVGGDSEGPGVPVAVLRSRANYIFDENTGQPTINFVADEWTISYDNGTDLTNSFTITVTPTDGSGTVIYEASLNPDSPKFIGRVFGYDPQGSALLYVEWVSEQVLRRAIIENTSYPLSLSNTGRLSGLPSYEQSWKTPETPYFVSERRGSDVRRLYKFVSISDGATANREIKITHENVDLNTRRFDVVIRDFNDTDDNPIVLERFSNCSMNPESNEFIGLRMGYRLPGQTSLELPLLSDYVILEMAGDTWEHDGVPCGFEGFWQPRFHNGSSGAPAHLLAPYVPYKASFTSLDRPGRATLGISDRAFATGSRRGQSLEASTFRFLGVPNVDDILSWTDTDGLTHWVQGKGFHLDIDAGGDGGLSIGRINGVTETRYFVAGPSAFSVSTDQTNSVNTYFDKTKRRFTCAPAGGFDGWDIWRSERTNTDDYRIGGTYNPDDLETFDYQAWEQAMLTFENPDSVAMGLLATPGLVIPTHSTLIYNAEELISRTRGGDAYYLVDLTDLGSDEGAEQEAADLVETFALDSSYSGTYYPYVQIADTQNSTRVWIPPTGEVARACVFNDKLKFIWWAVAGRQRGLLPRVKSVRRTLTDKQMDILFPAGINPIANYRGVGPVIWGDRTLQIAETALQFMSVRRMLIYAKGVVKDAAQIGLFDPSDDQVVSEFLRRVTPVFEHIKRERGLRNFLVRESDQTPESIARGQRYFEIVIQPMESLREVGITFILTRDGAVFEG